MFAIIASKKTFRRAVDRNLARRRIRAGLDAVKPGWRQDLRGKIVATPEVLTLPFPSLKIKLKHALSL
jgi:ribonuclease P protein component